MPGRAHTPADHTAYAARPRRGIAGWDNWNSGAYTVTVTPLESAQTPRSAQGLVHITSLIGA